MRTRKILFYIALGVLIPATFGLILPTQARADLQKKAVGSYLLRQSDGFQQILTLTTRGTVISQNSGHRWRAPGSTLESGRLQSKRSTLHMNLIRELSQVTDARLLQGPSIKTLTSLRGKSLSRSSVPNRTLSIPTKCRSTHSVPSPSKASGSRRIN
jgi:hypothetical protein